MTAIDRIQPLQRPAVKGIILAVSLALLSLGLVPATVASVASRQSCLEAEGEVAVEACHQALAADPDDLDLLLHHARNLTQLKRYPAAIVVLQKAAGHYPQDPTVAYRLKLVRSLEKEASMTAGEEGSAPGRKPALKDASRFRLHRIRCTRLSGEKALAACDEALALTPGAADLHHARGNILLKLDRRSEAVNAYREAFRLEPDNQKVLQKLVALGKAPETEATVASTKSAVSTPSTASKPVADKLALLRSLHEQDLIGDEEFKRRQAKILDSALKTGKDRLDRQELETPDELTGIAFGHYQALVIGIQNYKHLTPLVSTRRDANEVARILRQDYGFMIKTLLDPTRRDILLAMGELRRTLTDRDNLLIYYAGHGWLDEAADTGYWLPVNAAADNDVDWLSLDTVTSAVRAMAAKHVMIVADSCYSGKLTRGIHIKPQTSDYLTRMVSKRARVVLSSGGLEPVLDSGGKDGHSVFATAFLGALKENEAVMDGTSLFTRIRRKVMLNAQQTPEYSDIRKARHEGGDFIFVKR